MPQIMKEPGQRFMFLGVGFLLFIMGCSGLTLYWALDNELPVTGMSGKFIGWDKEDPNVGHIEWTEVRHRFCDVKASRFVYNGLDMADVTTKDTKRSHEVLPEGERHKTRKRWTTFEVPPGFRETATEPKYRVRLEYSCNPLQNVFPLIVAPPEVSLKVTEGKQNAVDAESIPDRELAP